MIIEDFINDLMRTKEYTDCLVAEHILPEQEATWTDFTSCLDNLVTQTLRKVGITKLYRHQAEAIQAILDGKNIVVSTGVASGKSLTYQIPVMQTLTVNPSARALLIYPTKALTQDQHLKFDSLLQVLAALSGRQKAFHTGIYDGDTPTSKRQLIRKQANLLFTNPDMLHLGILPHHSMWSVFFANLRYVIIDEVHIYRGVFGSHISNVLRRLKRIARFYGSNPQFIFTSATLSNAEEFITALLESPVTIIDKDTSPHGTRYFHLLNPPLLNPDLGIRKSSVAEIISLVKRFLNRSAQALLFTLSRRSAELLYIYLRDKALDGSKIQSYRSGYLPEQRRAVEKQLRDKKIELVITTNALELGIDIGGLDAVFLNGYPGSISATQQQIGRAGRQGKTSFAALVASSNTLDQYICHHPDYLWERSPEQALIDPNNPEILKAHLLCAVYEMAMLKAEGFGSLSAEQIFPILQKLVQEGKIRETGNRFIGPPETYPAGEVSLRNAPGQYLINYQDELIGIIDEAGAFWMAHPDAIYLQNGDTWLVKNLDIEHKKIEVEPVRTNYFTQATQETEIELQKLYRKQAVSGGFKHFGEVEVTTQITGFKKLRWFTQEIVGYGELDLPPSELKTEAWWLSLSPEVVKKVKDLGLWRNEANNYGPGWELLSAAIRKRDLYRCRHCGLEETDKAFAVHHITPFRKFDKPEQANQPDNLITLCPRCHRLAEQQVHIQSGLAGVSYLLGNIAPFFLMCDISDLGFFSEDASTLAEGAPVVVIYDNFPGGIGLSKKLYEISDMVLQAAYEQVCACACSEGCPSCTGPVAENGSGAKQHAKAILAELLAAKQPSAKIISFPPRS
ncbi:MAG TPA: DEAD/DEAH box helicase [Candidatus Cloacimonadota bacterium]|nr:DEAD/DEAH box helicase [Candidatus Cloacimonadota bacterium]HOV17122.1 DEAD/DEAH box helicase [Candidatus Cloacimonadota bacterium]HQL15424.1 DEAD/DEAH box helicase [Candidatus Cloacimonadota bacterium]